MYRKKASAIVVNKKGKFLLLQLQGYDNHQWNVPGGGREEGETPEQNILRELAEELGTSSFQILEKSSIVNRYDWPIEIVTERFAKTGIHYVGQIVDQFIVLFTGEDDEIILQDEEVRQYKWVSRDELKSHLLFPGQWENVMEVIDNSTTLS